MDSSNRLFEYFSRDASEDFAASEELRGQVPPAMARFWDEHGLPFFEDGLLQFAAPADLSEVLYRWLLGGSGRTLTPIASTGFGELIFIRKLDLERDHTPDPSDPFDVRFFSPHYRQSWFLGFEIGDAFERLDPERAPDSDFFAFRPDLRRSLFRRSVERHGALARGQSFHFAPALALGGSEALENVAKGDTNVHLHLLLPEREEEAQVQVATAPPPPGHDAEIAARLESGGDPNAPLDDGRLPLHRALESNDLKQAKKLLQAGADPRLLDDTGTSALMAAIAANAPEFLRRYRNEARTLSESDGPRGVVLRSHIDPPDEPHVVAIRRHPDALSEAMKRHNGSKPNRGIAQKVVLLEQRQAFLVPAGAWSLLLFHGATDRDRDVARGSTAVILSMTLGPALEVHPGGATFIEKGFGTHTGSLDEVQAAAGAEGLSIPRYRMLSDGVSISLELEEGQASGDMVEFAIWRFGAKVIGGR